MTKWLDRTLFKGPYLALVLNQKDFEVCKKDMGVTGTGCDVYCREGASATTHYYYNTKGQLACIVGLRDFKNHDGMAIAGLLVHEAVHVWQHTRSEITHAIDPSRTGGLEAEMEAYAIQNIAQTLMESFAEQVGL